MDVFDCKGVSPTDRYMVALAQSHGFIYLCRHTVHGERVYNLHGEMVGTYQRHDTSKANKMQYNVNVSNILEQITNLTNLLGNMPHINNKYLLSEIDRVKKNLPNPKNTFNLSKSTLAQKVYQDKDLEGNLVLFDCLHSFISTTYKYVTISFDNSNNNIYDICGNKVGKIKEFESFLQ